MFTRLDAAYNRCRVVRPWNGLSSASLLRLATTRCSRAYSPDCVATAECAGGWLPSASGRRLIRNSQSAAGCQPKAASSQRLSKFLGIAALICAPTLLVAQNDTTKPPVVPPKKLTAPPTSHPEVVNLTLKGVKVVRQD